LVSEKVGYIKKLASKDELNALQLGWVAQRARPARDEAENGMVCSARVKQVGRRGEAKGAVSDELYLLSVRGC